MPPVVVTAVISAAVTAGAYAITVGAITSAVVTMFVAIFVLSLATSMLMPKPKMPTLGGMQSSMDERKQMIKQPAHSRRIIYGYSKVSGVILFIETANNNQDLYMVLALASHEIDGVARVYIGDTPVVFNGDITTGFRTANNPSDFSGKVHAQLLTGTTTQTLPSDFTTNTDLATTDKFKGIACLCIKMNYNSNSFPNGIPAVFALVRGKKIHDLNRSGTHYSNNPAYIFRDYMTDTSFGVGATTSEIDDTQLVSAGSTCHSWFAHKDDSDNRSDEYTVFTLSGTNHYLNDGTVVTLHDGDELTFGGTAYYVLLTDALTQHDVGTDGATASKHQSFRLATSQANWRNRSASLPSNTSSITAERTKEIRYGCDGTLLSESTHETNLTQILSSCGGSVTYTGGVFRMAPSVYQSPSISFSDDDIIGPIELSTKIQRRERFNGVKGKFIGPENNWQESDFPAFNQSSFITEDGQTIFRDVPMPMTIAGSQAQRVAKTLLFQSRNEIQCQLTVNLKGLRLIPNDRVQVTSTRLGFTNQIFRVVSISFGSSGEALGSVLTLKEDTSQAYDFDPSSDAVIVDPTPDTNLPNFRTVSTPTINSFSNTGDLNNDGNILSSAIVNFTESTSGFIKQTEVSLEAQLSGSFVQVDTQILPQGSTQTRFGGLIVGRVYRAKVTCVSVLDVRSTTATSSNLTITADTTAPSAYTGLSASAIAEGVLLEFTNPSDADFRGAEFVMRTGTGNPNSGGDATINFSISANPSRVMKVPRTNLTAGTQQRFWVRSIDQTGNASAFFPNNADGITATPAIGGIDVKVGGSSIVSNGIANLGSFAQIDQISGANHATLIASGAIGSTVIADGAITTDKINAGAVNAGKISVSSLSSLTATIGTLQNASSGARLVLQSDKLQVFDSNNNERVRIGNLS